MKPILPHRSAAHYPDRLRRVTFCDPEDGKLLVFLTNNFDLPALVIAQLYKLRWRVELFFKCNRPAVPSYGEGAGMAGWQGETTINSNPPNPTTPHLERES